MTIASIVLRTQGVDKLNDTVFHHKRTVVIPAETGIYKAVNYLYNKYIRHLWMPAFAGMTEEFHCENRWFWTLSTIYRPAD